MMIVLSHYQLTELSRSNEERDVRISPDLGLTMMSARVDGMGLHLTEGVSISWQQVERIQMDQNGCFRVDEQGIQRIKVFSEASNRAYNLFPTAAAPTMLISGIPMHRIKDTNPWQDTLEKVKAFGGIRGSLLDTNTGLGYTAIAAAQQAEWVMTVEIEPAVLALCRENPWSEGLFGNPKISSVLGDSYEIVAGLADASFDNILHDPPTFALAGELYSGEFYKQLWRVLKVNGKLFHYTGNPESKTGANLNRSVVERLKAAGFVDIQFKPGAFGLLARR